MGVFDKVQSAASIAGSAGAIAQNLLSFASGNLGQDGAALYLDGEAVPGIVQSVRGTEGKDLESVEIAGSSARVLLVHGMKPAQVTVTLLLPSDEEAQGLLKFAQQGASAALGALDNALDGGLSKVTGADFSGPTSAAQKLARVKEMFARTEDDLTPMSFLLSQPHVNASGLVTMICTELTWSGSNADDVIEATLTFEELQPASLEIVENGAAFPETSGLPVIGNGQAVPSALGALDADAIPSVGDMLA